MFENFSVEYPYILLSILPFIFFRKYFKAKPDSYYIPNFYEALAHSKTKNYIKPTLKFLMLTSSLIALASPIVSKGMQSQKTKSIDIILSLDTSGSMSMTGFNPLNYEQNRWDVVKDVVKDFIKKRKHDRIGLVVFGTKQAVASALSYARETQLNIIDGIEIGIVGKSTALIDGLTSSIGLLKNTKNSSKIIILLTDGEDTSSKVPLDVALKFAKKHNIKIYTVAIDEGNSNILKLIAKKNDGKSFHANNKEDLSDIYKTIDSLEPSSIYGKKTKIVEYYAFYFIGFSLICSFLLLLMMRNKESM